MNWFLNKMAWTTGGTLIEQINYATIVQDFEKAEELLNEFKDKLDKNYFFLKEDRQKQYNTSLARFKNQKTHSQFFAAIEKYNVNNARENLNILVTEKLISKDEREALEERINDITEEGLFSQIQSARKDQKESLMEIYSRIYPEGKEGRKVTTDLIAEAFSRVLNSINTNIRFEELYEQVHKITLYLEKYSQNGVNLTNIVPVTEFSESVKKYLLKLITRSTFESGEIRLGSIVRYTEKSQDGYSEDLNGRDSEIPVGIEGIVIEYADCDETYTVDFSSSKQSERSCESIIKEQLGVEQNQEEFNSQATQQAEILIFGKKGKFEGKIGGKKGKKKLPQTENKNTAQFYSDELEVREQITEIDKNLVKNELYLIEELFVRHYSGKTKEKYLSQDFPKGINELVSK